MISIDEIWYDTKNHRFKLTVLATFWRFGRNHFSNFYFILPTLVKTLIRKRPTFLSPSFFLFSISISFSPFETINLAKNRRFKYEEKKERKKRKYRSSSRGFRYCFGYSKQYFLHFYERIIDRIIRNSQRIGILFVGIFYSLLLSVTPFRTELRSINIQKSSRKIDRSSWTFFKQLSIYILSANDTTIL